MSKSKGTRYTRQEREELLALYHQSGYTVSRFCAEMDISYGTIKRWLGRQSTSVSLVEVATLPPSASSSLRVRLPNGIECELVAGLGREETLSWIRGLKSC
ncbi:transposase [Puniceicoccaceae bacterium K14]|nr:transposase [Puniceicoccaceae bacterium K14]